MKKLRYDPKSIRSRLTLVTLLCWILPIIIIVTMFSVLVNYYNDRNLEQAMDLGMENAMQQVELRLLSVIEDSKAVSYDGIANVSITGVRIDGVEQPVAAAAGCVCAHTRRKTGGSSLRSSTTGK